MSSAQTGAGLSQAQRWTSFVELLFGTCVVIGHNVFHVVPNEVPILFVLFWLSLRIREGSWRTAGLKAPESWRRLTMLAVVAAAVMLVGSELLVQPLAKVIWHRPERVSSLAQTSVHDWKFALRTLSVVWAFAFGEEIGYRGYLLRRAADLGNRSPWAYGLAMIYVAVLFGFGHFYKGPGGVLDSTYSGLILGTVFLISRRNLWASILAHGISDTVAVAALLAG